MTDEIEAKLLKGCGKEFAPPDEDILTCGEEFPDDDGEPWAVYCPQCVAKLEQHRQTKKCIEENIRRVFQSFRQVKTNDIKIDKELRRFLGKSLTELERLLGFKKQISGEGK